MPPKKRSSAASTSSSKRARTTVSLSPDEEPASPPTSRPKRPTTSNKTDSLPLAAYIAKVATDGYAEVQNQLCQRWKRTELDEHCTSCIEKQAHCGGCRFIELRAFRVYIDENGRRKVDRNDYAFLGNQGAAPAASAVTKKPATKKKEPKKEVKKAGTIRRSGRSRNPDAGSPEQDNAKEEPEEEPIVIPPDPVLPTAAHAKYVFSLIAPTFADHLRREKCHEDVHVNLAVPESADRGGRRPMIRIQASPLTRSLCDICATSIFMGSYLCGCCGRELCLGCWEEWEPSSSQPNGKVRRLDNCSRKRRHSRQSMLFTTRATPGELCALIDKVSAYEGASAEVKNDENDDKLVATIPTEKQSFPCEEGPLYYPVPKIRHSDLSQEAFQALWRKGGIPLVLTGLQNSFQLPWDPAYFRRYFGKEDCLIHDCVDDSVFESNVAQFFESFAAPNPAQSWKLKDWPPTADFSTTFPSLFADFENAIPFPAYTRRKGPLNLASYFPETANPPDLGPKMYNAFPAPDFLPKPRDEVKGTTNLHLDLTDAVNIMVYTAASTDETRDTSASNGVPKDVGAVWDFFKPEDAGALRQYLKEKYDPNIDDPIHRQLYYLSEEDLTALAKEGIGSYRVFQNPGEAVWIPAGCAHQVRNRKASVKVAVDFLSAENVPICKRLQEEARSMAGEFMRGLGKKEDVLQLWAGCGWAWDALEKVLKEEEMKNGTGNGNGTVEVRAITVE